MGRIIADEDADATPSIEPRLMMSSESAALPLCDTWIERDDAGDDDQRFIIWMDGNVIGLEESLLARWSSVGF